VNLGLIHVAEGKGDWKSWVRRGEGMPIIAGTSKSSDQKGALHQGANMGRGIRRGEPSLPILDGGGGEMGDIMKMPQLWERNTCWSPMGVRQGGSSGDFTFRGCSRLPAPPLTKPREGGGGQR